MNTLSSTPQIHSASRLLETRAVEQRRRIHNAVVELSECARKSTPYRAVHILTQLRSLARTHVIPVAAAAVVLGLAFGYHAGGDFA